MTLKKIGSLLLATLMVVGLSSAVSAQTILGDNDGVRIRVVNPATGEFAGIGDIVFVHVEYLKTIAPDDIVMAVVTDTSLTAGAITPGMNDGVSIRAGGVETAASGTEFVGNVTSAATILATETAVDGETAFKKITFTFNISATSGAEVSTATLAVVAKVSKGATSGVYNNLRTAVPTVGTDPTGTSFGFEGDGILFGVDSNRPVGALSAVLIDEDRGDGLDAIANNDDDTIGELKKNQRFPSATYPTDEAFTADATAGVTGGNPTVPNVPRTAFNTGDILKASFTVSNPPSGATGVIHISDPADVAAGNSADSAFVSFTFSFNDLLGGSVADSVTLAESALNVLAKASGDPKYVGDNRRIVAAAFLTDRAGNLSHSSNENSLTPQAVTDPNIHVLDLTDPVVTPVRPVIAAAKQAVGELPDSTRFTALVTSASLSITSLTDGTTTTGTTFNLNPLEFESSEGVTAIKISFDDGVADYDTTADAAQILGLVAETATTFDLSGGFTMAFSDSAGHSGDLTITLTDSSGNKADDTQEGVNFDGFAPQFRSFFPTTVGAPTDPDNADAATVNSATANPVIELSEALDSLGVQYVQNTAVSPNTSVVRVSPGDVNLSVVGSSITITLSDSLVSNQEYQLQIFQRDLAGNVSITAVQTLTYDDDFQNPAASEFLVTPAETDVVAGQALIVTVTARDSALSADAGGDTIVAVTHDTEAFIRVAEVAAAKKAGHTTYTIEGTGVTDNEDGTATLNGAGWNLGVRTVEIKSTEIIDKFVVVVEDKTGEDVNFDGQTDDTLSVEAADFRAYSVKAMEDGVETDGVSGDFTVWVQPTDEFGNASVKVFTDPADPADSADPVGSPAALDSLELLADNNPNVVVEIFVEFSANSGDAQIPQGPQAVAEAGTGFTVVAPDRAGEGLWISVRTFNASGAATDTTPYTKYLKATGSTGALTFTAFGEAPPPPSTDLEAPAALIVQDYLGADGAGDQGGFVIVSYSAVDGATRYRLYREIDVTTGLDENGDLAIIDPAVKTWVPWAAFDPADDDGIGRNVVPTLDGVATNWAIAAERGGSSSGQTAASKRVFTKQLVQNMVTFLNVDPNRVLSTEELGKVFAPSEDYVKSIIGDQKNVQFAALDVDFTALLGGASTVPQSIRTQTSQIQSSARTATEEPVKAVDNLPPAAVEGAGGTFDGANVSLAWQVSSDDRMVGSMSYLGYSIPIAGVDRYEVWRGESADALELYATLSAGETTFVDQEVPGVASVIYRIDAADLDNVTPGTQVDVFITTRQKFLTADGEPVYIILINGGSPLTQDFEDFLAFANAYMKSVGEPGFLLQADTDDSGTVDFTDFLAFASAFLAEAVAPAGAKVVPIQPLPGVNDNVELALSLSDSKVLAGQTVTVNVALANATALSGFGFEMLYDADKFEYIESAASEQDLLKSGGAETPLFLAHPVEAGQLVIANAVIDGAPVSGNGEVVSLTFKVLQEFEENARFEIADGIVFDHEQLPNPVVALGSLSVESTPTEFALLQNFPNPFNPETTINYNLAEGTNVSLRIYNVVGQVVRTLVAEPQSAGRYTVRWNGSDDRGVSVSSGIYFYELRSNGFQDVKKLMLLK